MPANPFQDPNLVPGGPQDQVNGPTPVGGAADPYGTPSEAVYDQFNVTPQTGTSAGQNFQAQGLWGNAMGVPGGGTSDANAAPTPSAAQIPPQGPQAPPQTGPANPIQPPGAQEMWQGGPGLYGGIWKAMSDQQRQQYLGLQGQDTGLQPMARGGQQSNVGRRQAMWSVLNQDNIYQNAPTDWGSFGGDNWSGYGGG